MFAAAVAKLTNSIFPIYCVTRVNPSLVTFQVAASAFFVDAYGTFVTVAHAFNNRGPDTVFQYRGRSPDDVHNPPINLIELACNELRDVVVGRVPGLQLTHGLDISETEVAIGASVCVGGYPLPQLSIRPDGVLEISAVRRYFQDDGS